MGKWVCSYDRSHVFDVPTADYYCPKCPPLTGLLIEEEVVPEVEVGLCVILMDASLSMTEPGFKGNPLTKMRLVSDSAAMGIFDLQRMHNNPNAIVAAFKFDNRCELMFMDSVANLIRRFKEVKTFADHIYAELFKMQEGTDINKALRTAHSFVKDFLNGTLPNFPVEKYTPMIQRLLDFKNSAVTIANTRVLIYTDGMQYDANENRVLNPNPFQKEKLPNLNHDIVIGAFFGQAGDEGCNELKSILSNCPVHNTLQFFLFDKPTKIGDLKYLFRMASGASGFCPMCLEQLSH